MTLLAVAAALSGCMSDDEDISELESGLSSNGWLNDLEIPSQSTPYQVGVAPYAGRLVAIYRSSSGNLLRSMTFDGTRWSSSSLSNLQADYGPSLTAHNGQLVTVFKSAGQNRLLMATSTSGIYWSSPSAVNVSLGVEGVLRYAPAVTSFDNALYVGYCFRDNYGEKARVARLGTTGWTTMKTWYLTDSTCKSFAFGRNNDGRMNVVFNTETSSTWYLYNAFINLDGSVTTGSLLTMKSKKPSSLVSCGGITHFVHGGYSEPDAIYWTYRRSDGTWAQDAKVPSQASHGGAAVACYGTRAIMVHNGGYDQLWWSEYVPD